MNLRESLNNHYLVPNGKVDDVRADWMTTEVSTGVSIQTLYFQIVIQPLY